MEDKLVVVFGGSGFIGRNVVRELARRGARVLVACRDVEAAKFLKPMGAVGQIAVAKIDVTDAAAIARAVRGADAVVNLVGILYESGRNRFDAVQSTAPGLIAQAAKDAGVGRMVQLSAIGADPNGASAYARSKGAGEAAVRRSLPDAVILRPSIVIGPNDDFFNKFGAMAVSFPALPLIGGGRTKFQPVYVDDVADAVLRCLEDPSTAGKTYELGGPGVYSFEQLMRILLAHIQRKRRLVPVPMWAARLKAAVLELLPKPPLTRDQLKLLQLDNVVADGALGLSDLGIEPTAMEVVLPTYLDRFRPGGRYNRTRVAV